MEEKVLPLLIPQPNHRSWQLLASEATKTHSQGLAPFFWILHLKLKQSVTQGWPAGSSWAVRPGCAGPPFPQLPSLVCPHMWVLRVPRGGRTGSFFCFASRNLVCVCVCFEALEPGDRVPFYHLRDTSWTDHWEFLNIQLTDILRASILSGFVPGLGEAEIEKIRVAFSFYCPSEKRAWPGDRAEGRKCQEIGLGLLVEPGDHGTVAWAFWASDSSSVTLAMGLDDLSVPSTSNVRCWRACGHRQNHGRILFPGAQKSLAT